MISVCSACKNKTSTDRCPNKVLKGLSFCGTHAKSKTRRIWSDVNKLDNPATLIQKVWRGYFIRHWLKLAGEGVLNRKNGHNEEELFTMEGKNSVYPLDYFSFEENGKLYWFDIRSLAEYGLKDTTPRNPYTREALTIETRRRLRTLCVMRYNHRLANRHDPNAERSYEDIMKSGWIQICQIVHENGFFDEMKPEIFIAMPKFQLSLVLSMFKRDLISWAAEHTFANSRRHKYVQWIRRLMTEYAKGIEHDRFTFLASRVIMAMMNDSVSQYDVCFMFMSALYRL